MTFTAIVYLSYVAGVSLKNAYSPIYSGGSYFAENGNLPIFMADNGKMVYTSVDFGHKKVTEISI